MISRKKLSVFIAFGFAVPFKVIDNKKLSHVSGGRWVVWYTVAPFTCYKNTKTGATYMKQTMSTADYTFGTMAYGWAKSAHYSLGRVWTMTAKKKLWKYANELVRSHDLSDDEKSLLNKAIKDLNNYLYVLL